MSARSAANKPTSCTYLGRRAKGRGEKGRGEKGRGEKGRGEGEGNDVCLQSIAIRNKCAANWGVSTHHYSALRQRRFHTISADRQGPAGPVKSTPLPPSRGGSFSQKIESANPALS
jgi:hypothetical protein